MRKKPANKTLEQQVQEPPFQTLYKNARKLLEGAFPPYTDRPTLQDLTNVLDTVAKEKFQRNYGYAYQGAQSKPKIQNVKNLSALNALLNISSNTDNQIVNYVQFLLNSTNVKSKSVLDTSRAQLVEQGMLLFNATIQDAWTALPFDKSYEEPEPDKNPWKADISMVECNAGIKVDGQGAKYTFIYFVGVYYEMISQDALKAKLFKILLDSAKRLPNAATNVTALDVQGLQSVLVNAAKTKFHTDYQVGFNGNATSPKDLAVGKEADVRGTSAIYYLPNNDPPNLKTFIETNILSAIEFTRNDVRFAATLAYSALEKELTDVLKNSTGNSWLSATFSQTYNSQALNENSLRTISVLFYTNAELSDGPFSMKAKFISYLGVYYHVPSPEEKAVTTLLTKLYANASRLYNPPKQFPQPPSTQGLEQILDDYAKLKFKEIYGIPYEGDATQPKDIIPADRTNWTLSSNLSTVVIKDDEWDDLELTIDIQITSGLVIPEWLKSAALAELKNPFKAAKRVSVDSSIKSAKVSKISKDPIMEQGFDWKSLAILTFTNGVLVEGGIKVTRTFINYIGVYYPIKPMGSGFGATFARRALVAAPEEDFVLL